jgi:hypothetical protein
MDADADVAQLVERDLAKVEVAGSSPVVRSREFLHPGRRAGMSVSGDTVSQVVGAAATLRRCSTSRAVDSTL